ncbi:MAG TPA: GNAT family N-acetyltransferase [Roseiflexaceae bacterium]|nr:GNAT family N-acetyltransferase [Roseiflexaceae bacterium]
MPIKLVETDEEIAACYPVMVQLRPHLSEQAFLEQVRRQKGDGFLLAALEEGGQVRALAGFRVIEMLSRGRHVYVDDLVTDAHSRSAGHGRALMDWLKNYARAQGCARLHLDSGTQRTDAHRFYFRERLHISAFNFHVALDGDS